MIDKMKSQRETIVVVGNGMVGHRFCELLVERDTDRRFRIVTFCEEPRAAYDRVHLSAYFEHRDSERLRLARIDWYEENGIELFVGDRAVAIDRDDRSVRSASGRIIPYDRVVLATGSSPFVPGVPGVDKEGIFVYRTIEDLEKIISYASNVRKAAVIGGGLLGLEAAKAVLDLGLETHVVEFAPRLMPRQIDDRGSRTLVEKIERMGTRVHLNKSTKEFLGNGRVEALSFADGEKLEVEMVVISAGIRPRDELARTCGLEVGPRGGVVVNDELRTSDPDIFAIGEVALHREMIYGLVAPGYEMADVLADRLLGKHRTFVGADLSTKLKLMGIDVAGFGESQADEALTRALTYEDPFNGVYQKLIFNLNGDRLLGGILIGDASAYGTLLAHYKSPRPLSVPPGELLLGKKGSAAGGGDELDDDSQVCSCNNVSKSRVCAAVREQGCATLDKLKATTRAGTGCGGCLPLVTDLLKTELKKMGLTVNNHLCEHFSYSRQDLFEIAKIKGIKSFDELIAGHGRGLGCEICKPAAASIFASLWNESILDQAGLQDTNDRFLANIQRGGLYSIVPRVPGGEITPEKLIALGEVARKHQLYSKITGGQRIDLFGAEAHKLPEIWEELIEAGFESGHAYGKALRTVKSCVGTTWCRYGVGDAVGLAIRLELRYRGIRSPHKLKAGVSGCIRECAEAQAKDFGIIAVENGWNLYVCGNGGSNPRHADLLAADLDEETVVKYLDRFIMYYIQTADRLTRTSVWLEKMEGGLDHLKAVIIEDKLGICADLERQLQFLVDSYRCEWREVVEDPEKRRLFRQFVNTDETESSVEFISERDQRRPIGWTDDFVPLDLLADRARVDATREPQEKSWVSAGRVVDFPKDAGACVKHGDAQIAVFNTGGGDSWYACQNLCPHKRELVLSRGIVGDASGTPKVACPLHKKTFSLLDGECLSGDEGLCVEVFPVKVEDGEVFVELPDPKELESLIAESSCRDRCSTA